MAMALLAYGAYAQTANELPEKEVQPRTADVKGFQWGVSVRFEQTNFVNSHIATNVSMGYRFNRGNYLGLQSGFAFRGNTYIDADPGNYAYRGVPLLADYIHYFPLGKAKKHSFYAGAEAGSNFVNYYKGFGGTWVRDGDMITYTPGTLAVNKSYAYLGVKTGLDLKLGDGLHLQLGTMMSYFGLGLSAGLTF